MACHLFQKFVRMNLYRWVIMLVIGVLTAMIAVSIDISIEQLAGWKYKIIKSRIFSLQNEKLKNK